MKPTKLNYPAPRISLNTGSTNIISLEPLRPYVRVTVPGVDQSGSNMKKEDKL